MKNIAGNPIVASKSHWLVLSLNHASQAEFHSQVSEYTVFAISLEYCGLLDMV